MLSFNRNGKLARFYLFFGKDGEELPQDLCTYFWGLVGRGLFMVVVPGQILGWLVYGLVMLAMFVMSHKRQTGKVLAAVVAVTVIIALAIWFKRRTKKAKKIEMFSEAKAVIGGKVDAVKNRHCPRIEWRG